MRTHTGMRPCWLLCLSAVLLFVIQAPAQTSAAKRQLLNYAPPPYPALARNMALQGVVKLEVLVASDGSVKTVTVKGGHPILTQAATNAVRRWRWEPRTQESHEVVQVKFAPNE